MGGHKIFLGGAMNPNDAMYKLHKVISEYKWEKRSTDKNYNNSHNTKA